MIWYVLSCNTALGEDVFLSIYIVSHFSYAPLFQGTHFLTKMLESTFSMIIYLLTFYLFGEIKKIRNHSCESFYYVKGNLRELHVQPERLYLLFAFCARHYTWWSL